MRQRGAAIHASMRRRKTGGGTAPFSSTRSWNCFRSAAGQAIELLDHLLHVALVLRVAEPDPLTAVGDLRVHVREHLREAGQRLRAQVGGTDGLRSCEIGELDLEAARS